MALGPQIVAVDAGEQDRGRGGYHIVKTMTPIKSVSNKESTHRHYVIMHRFNIILFVV